MESLGDVLRKKKSWPGRSASATGTSSSGEAAPETGAEQEAACPVCKGTGWVRREVPLGHPDFGNAFPCQCQRRTLEQDRLRRLQEYSNLGPLERLTFDNLVATGRRSDPTNRRLFQVALDAAREFAANPHGWLVLAGPTGCGKTHLAAAIANHSIQNGQPVLFVIVPDLLDHLRSAFAPGRDVDFDILFEQVRAAPVLILDDLGAHSGTPWAQEKIYQLLNHRFNAQLPTVVTTAIPIPELDERLRTRLTDPGIARVLQVEKESAGLLFADSLDSPKVAAMTFDTFDTKRPGLDREQRDNLERAYRMARDYAQSPEGWLVFLGGHGSGKSHLAAAIAHYRRQMGEDVLFLLVSDLLDHLRKTFRPESEVTYDEVSEKMRNAPLLALDEFGEDAGTPWAEEKLYQIINHRYNLELPTIITSSLKLEEIGTRFRHVGQRIVSRLADVRVCNVYEITAPDYRNVGRPQPRGPRDSALGEGPRRARQRPPGA